MELEKLNKSQIVLLTLLVSFVTSIATGIVTVSLLEQAPPAITQTVNRIVERTIEKVAPASQAASASMVETVVVRESDLITQTVARVSPSVVRLFMPGVDEAGKEMQLFIGHALVIDAGGILITDAGMPDGTLTALRTDGIEVPVTVIARPEGANVIRLQAATTTGEKQETLSWAPVSLSSQAAELGSAVVTIAGRTSPRVAQGIVTGVSDISGKETKAGIVETDIPVDAFAAGSPLMDIDGNIIAIATRESRAAAAGGFLASSAIVLDNKTSGDTEGGSN
ncbi:MAG: serine protease [Patescibacteria group bacterium]